MIKTLKKTRLSESVTSRRMRLDPEGSNETQGVEEKYRRYLDRLKGNGKVANRGTRAYVTSRSGTAKYQIRTTSGKKAS